jgi:hypothetical protein
MFPLPGLLASFAVRSARELAALAMETLARGRVEKNNVPAIREKSQKFLFFMWRF